MGRVVPGTGATGCSTWANGCGIFTSVSGNAPNRILNIEWHVVSREDDSLTGNFEVRLYENNPDKRFDVIYGVIQRRSGNYDSAGVQGSTGFFTQDFCDVPPPQNVSSTYTMLPSPLQHPRRRRRSGSRIPMTAVRAHCARRSLTPMMATQSISILR